jgi:hypothetical protein
MKTLTINGQAVKVPAGMIVQLGSNGNVSFVPVAHKSTKSQTVHPPKPKAPEKPIYDPAQTKKFYSKENLEAIKNFFVAKNGITTKDDATSLAATLGIPVGIIMSQFRKKSLAVCYGNITLPNVDVFLAYCTSQKWRTAQVYNDLAETRKANLAKSQATFS